MKKAKRKCETTVESMKHDLNKGDEERFSSARYRANPYKGFWDALRKAHKRMLGYKQGEE